MKYLPLDPQLFTKNRQRFMAKMQPHSVAIFNSNDELPSNGDALHPFKQSSDLFWLSGIDQEESMIILYPDNPDPKYREVLVLVRPNEVKEKWDGHRLRKDEALAISGISTIVWLDALDVLLQQWVHEADNIYLNTNENNRKASLVPVRDYRYAAEMRGRYPLHNYLRAAKVMKELRASKTSEEIKVIQQAIDITEKAFRRLLQFIRPGVWEHEIHAEILHEFLRNRATGEAYGSIIASGNRARTLHYVANNQECKEGELILMDFGAAYGGYNADLTRTVPISGRFTTRQRQVYDACLHLHNYAKSILKPGITIARYHEMVGVEAGMQFVQLGLLTEGDIRNQDPENPAYRKYLYHGISHHLGVDVHDLAPSFQQPIPEGALLTVEPGIYIEDEQMGIRIENNIWLTAKGNIDLMKNIPETADEIEALMKR